MRVDAEITRTRAAQALVPHLLDDFGRGEWHLADRAEFGDDPFDVVDRGAAEGETLVSDDHAHNRAIEGSILEQSLRVRHFLAIARREDPQLLEDSQIPANGGNLHLS